MPEPSELFSAPDDLTQVSDAFLAELEERGVEEFDRVHALGPGNYSDKDIEYALNLRNDLNRIKAELSARTVRAETQAALAKSKAERQMAELNESVHGPAEGTPEAAAAVQRTELDREEAIAAAAARGTMTALAKVMGDRRGMDVTQATERMVASLGATARVAPKPEVPEARLSVTASATGNELRDMEALAAAFTEKAQGIPITTSGKSAARHPVAKIHNTFKHTVDMRTSPMRVEEVYRDLVNRETQESLVAGGGWCAPSEIMYDFFNIADMPSNPLDLPTVGVSRGGIQFPVSPAIGDTFFTSGASNAASGFGGFAFSFANSTDPWLWSETDDILTVTGSVNKPTLRVPCASFSTQRLEAYGLTVTAGNLTDSAYPEQTANFIRLLRAAYAHAINARLLTLIDNASTVGVTPGGLATDGASSRIPNAVDLAATDYRNRFAMRDDAVLEVVLPYWVKSVIRADLAWKPGVNSFDLLSVSDAQVDSLFSDERNRVQWVSDYQVRGSGFGGGTPLTVWPTTVNFLMYAAGTFLHGQGMSLDLGVVRDSVLNAENDFTAAWAEETHLIAKVGHESRKYTTTFNVAGTVGGTGVQARV